jgi:hypothetical protein
MYQQAGTNNVDQAAAIRAAVASRNNSEAPIQFERENAVESAWKPYQFLLVDVLRDSLALEFRSPVPFLWDKERVLDDFGDPHTRDPEGQTECVRACMCAFV